MANIPVVVHDVTLDDARQAVSGIINEPLEGQFSATVVDRHLNACARRIFKKVNREYSDVFRSTEVGTPNYVLPDALVFDGKAHVKEVLYKDLETALTPIAYKAHDMTSGTPDSFAVLGNELWLYPAPDAINTLRIQYKRDYLPLAEATDVFPLTDEQVDVCVLYAAYMMKLMDEEYTAAGMLKTQYEDAFTEAVRFPTGVYKYAQPDYT